MQKLLIIFLSTIVLSSCVGKKKYDELVKNTNITRDSLQGVLSNANAQITQLRLDVATKEGANQALFQTQDRLQDRLDDLQLEIDRLNKNASNQKQDLSGQVANRDQTIAEKQAVINETKALLQKQQDRLAALGKVLEDSIKMMELGDLQISPRREELRIDIPEDILFQKGSTSRLKDEADVILAEVVEQLESYPEMVVIVLGHTDNQPVRRKSLNNWQYTALRAVTIVESLTEEHGLGTNRIMAASKSEYQPKASNETDEGRSQNRRIEIRIIPDQRSLLRELEKSLAKG